MAEAQELLGVSPEENEKAKLCSDDPTEKMRLSDSFKAREETVRHNWLEQFVPEWPPAMMLEEGHIKKFMNQLVVMLQMPESSGHAEADEIVIPVIGEPAYHDRAAVATSGFSQSQVPTSQVHLLFRNGDPLLLLTVSLCVWFARRSTTGCR